jgi:peptide-methionine (R)-S-oxide reductase
MLIFRAFAKFNLSHLSPLQFAVTQQKSTEPPFSSSILYEKTLGAYKCVVCETELFNSTEKFDSRCGWPSFYRPNSEDKVVYQEDISHGMIRTEVLCKECGSHLGHWFPDGPKKTRFCINGCCLKFEAKKNH